MLDSNTVQWGLSRLVCGLAASLAIACAGDDDSGTSAASETATSTTTGGGGESTGTSAADTSTSGSASAGETSTGDATTSTSTSTDSDATTSTGADTTTAGSTTTGGADFGCDDPIFADDFDDDAVGLYADLDDWNEPPWDNGVDEGRVEIIDGAAAFSGRSLRIHYPKGGVGPSEGGAQWRADLGGAYDELYLAYRVRFADGFDFVLGGKLPGLVGGSAPTGCVADTDGFSARSMWRKEGHGVQYMYFPEKQNSCGDDYDYTLGGEPALFEPGVWHTLEHRVVMNTPGEHDGHLQAWLDGQLVLDAPDFLFRLADGDYAIDALYFSTFFGGSGDEWAPTKDEAVDFDDFVVCAAPISH
ncbi:MAG: hypothetical protein KC486_13980 [Myxococcales bacterium]|nr:hypothetical protein [Myxococcales bacterium]